MQKTPGIYTDINTQTQRTGLPSQNHSIVFMTDDMGAPAAPKPIYDTASADKVSGVNSNAGRMIAAALSVSQGVAVETLGKSDSLPSVPNDEDIQCTPTAVKLTSSVSPDAITPTQLTISRNGDAAETIISPDLNKILHLAPDGTSYAFLSQVAFGIYPEPVGTDISVEFAGLSTAGVVFNGVSYDPKKGFEITSGVSSVPESLVATSVVAESNTIAILPTPGATRSDDMYYNFGGNDAGDPVVLTSCAKAIVKTAPATDPMPA